jgi:hypothetical protein
MTSQPWKPSTPRGSASTSSWQRYRTSPLPELLFHSHTLSLSLSLSLTHSLTHTRARTRAWRVYACPRWPGLAWELR